MAAHPHIFVLSLALVFCAIPQATLADSGTATYYTEYVPSSCYGFDTPGGMIAAASDEFWEGGAACGRTYSVTCTGATNLGDLHPCTGKSVVVKIVDYCPAGCRGTIDLSEEAFKSIAHPAAGKVYISYDRYVYLMHDLHDCYQGQF
ncbi:hypothetical protein NL676_031907 [Syzygium grande]|nr:hypothetical protein NL676_031907 [Syzygium grande]